jgi:transposase
MLDDLIAPLVRDINSRLVEASGVGVEIAAQLLVCTGEHHQRVRSEASFAMLCGLAPVPASSA